MLTDWKLDNDSMFLLVQFSFNIAFNDISL